MSTKPKTWLKVVLCALLVLALAVGGYVAYVFLAYYRLEDSLPLTAEGAAALKDKTRPCAYWRGVLFCRVGAKHFRL